MSLFTSRSTKKTQTDQSILHVFLSLSEKWKFTKFFLVRMLLVQRASMNVFYSMWKMVGVIFHKSVHVTSLYDFFNRHFAAFFWGKCFEGFWIFFYKWNFFKKLKTSLEVCFYNMVSMFLTHRLHNFKVKIKSKSIC